MIPSLYITRHYAPNGVVVLYSVIGPGGSPLCPAKPDLDTAIRVFLHTKSFHGRQDEIPVWLGDVPLEGNTYVFSHLGAIRGSGQ